MRQTLNYNKANFSHTSRSLSVEVSKIYLNAMIFSHIYYCVVCWSQANETVFKPIRSLCKQVPKILDRKSQQYHHCDILVKCKRLTLIL